MTELKTGDIAPSFTLPDHAESDFTLTSCRGKKVVLYFYPKDDTPGCTKQAMGFNELIDEFSRLNSIIVGISKDSVSKHAKFRSKHDLNLQLISDYDQNVTELYGAWVKKKMYGKTYMGIERCTFLIDDQGKIRKIWRKVKVKGHAQKVLDTVKSIQKHIEP